jgi:uncharacterized protein YlxW (UPF0749 family)
MLSGSRGGKFEAQREWLADVAHPDDLSLLVNDLYMAGVALVGEDGRRINPREVCGGR